MTPSWIESNTQTTQAPLIMIVAGKRYRLPIKHKQIQIESPGLVRNVVNVFEKGRMDSCEIVVPLSDRLCQLFSATL